MKNLIKEMNELVREGRTPAKGLAEVSYGGRRQLLRSLAEFAEKSEDELTEKGALALRELHLNEDPKLVLPITRSFNEARAALKSLKAAIETFEMWGD